MDSVISDDLLQEIFIKLPATPSPSFTVSLVSKRWLRLYRASRTSLSLRVSPKTSVIPSLSDLLSQFPFLSALSVCWSDNYSSTACATVNGSRIAFYDHLISAISSCSRLENIRFAAGPISSRSLIDLSRRCNHVRSLTVYLYRPLSFDWVACFPQLKDLSVTVWYRVHGEIDRNRGFGLSLDLDDELIADSGLETLCLVGVRSNDRAINQLWKRCRNLKKLQLKSCYSTGDEVFVSKFVKSAKGLQEVELWRCSDDVILRNLAENCDSLNAFVYHDGGSRDGLLEFISKCKCKLQKLELFHLPRQLFNDHLLSAVAASCRCLKILRFQDCYLFNRESLKRLVAVLAWDLEEFALINFPDVVTKTGLLAKLAQSLRVLKKLDLSRNEKLVDKEFVSMMASCNQLTELRLRGCELLTGAAMVSVSKNCKQLESVDIVDCTGITAEDVDLFLLDLPQLREVHVEKSKLSETAETLFSDKLIQVTFS